MTSPPEIPGEAFAVMATLVKEAPNWQADLGVDDQGQSLLRWQGPASWTDDVCTLLDQAAAPGLATLLPGNTKLDDASRLLLDCRCDDAEPFDLWKWRNLPRPRAVRALQSLALAVEAIHDAGWTLDGLHRDDLVMSTATDRLILGTLQGLRPVDSERETLWRDIRCFGELAYENFLEHEYPGGHELVSLLQEPSAMADVGIIYPGLAQLLAGCVTPYGDLAYQSTDDLLQGLEHLHTELERGLTYRVGARSTQGNHIFRQNNQDSCAHVVVQSTCGSRSLELGFFCVADGIGGIDDGERASAQAVHTACAAFMRAWTHYDADELRAHPTELARAITQVTSQRLALDGDFNPTQNRGGCTFTACLLVGDRLGVAHVGDSRALLFRQDELIPLTDDHTLAAILEKLGESPGPKSDASHRTIARFLSTGSELEWRRIDGIGQAAADRLSLNEDQRQTAGIALLPGDLLILTSDGAHDEVDGPQISRLARRYRQQPQKLCDAIVDISLKNIGRDNATVVAIYIDDGQ